MRRRAALPQDGGGPLEPELHDHSSVFSDTHLDRNHPEGLREHLDLKGRTYETRPRRWVGRRNKNGSGGGSTDPAEAQQPRKVIVSSRGGREAGTDGSQGDQHSPGHLHQRGGHGGGVDGQVSVQVHDDADVEHVDADWKTERRRERVRRGGWGVVSRPDASR